MSSSYAPDEPSDVMRDEVTWLQGAFLSTLLCGVQITLSAMSFLAVLKQRMRHRLRVALLVYISLLCVTMTAGQQVNLIFVQMGFIEFRNYPGGPNGFLSNRHRTPVYAASTCMFVFANWMMESLLVWRCKVVCRTGDRPGWIGVIVPSVLLAAEYVTGSVFLHELLHSDRDEEVIKFALAYSTLSFVLNVSVTGIIAGRLLLHRRRMVKQFGPGHGSHYASAAAIVIESASFYTGFLLLFIVLFCIGTPVTNVLQQAVAQVESIASLLIIYRIALGKGWKYDAGVSSVDWRGNESRPEVEPEVVDLEITASPAQTSVQAPSILSKDETRTPMSASSADATLPQQDMV